MADRQPRRGTTPRGFIIYDSFDDRNGNRVRVQESSAATEDCAWVFVGDQNAAAHLNVEQATWLRDALTVFIGEHRG